MDETKILHAIPDDPSSIDLMVLRIHFFFFFTAILPDAGAALVTAHGQRPWEQKKAGHMGTNLDGAMGGWGSLSRSIARREFFCCTSELKFFLVGHVAISALTGPGSAGGS
jgi:hypothetical protein